MTAMAARAFVVVPMALLQDRHPFAAVRTHVLRRPGGLVIRQQDSAENG
jgi:hypothetical protein